MNPLIFFSIFSVLAVTYLIIGIYASKNVSTTEDYFLAGRNLGFASVTFTLIATQLGGGLLLGTAERAYHVGWYGLLYTLGVSLGFLMLGMGIAAKLQSLNVATTAQLFETHYRSPALKKIASLLSIITMSGLLVGQVVASRTLLVGLGIESELLFFLLWAFIITYTMAGGLTAVVVTDIAQVSLIIMVFGGLWLYHVISSPASLTTLVDQQAFFSIDTTSWYQLAPLIIMPALFSLIEQDLAQRFFAAKSKRVAFLSACASSVFLLLFAFIPLYFGMQAHLSNMALPVGASPLIPFLEATTHSAIFALAVCGISAAITSTADSLLCAISSNVAQDFDLSFLGVTNKLKLSQLVTLITGIVCFSASYSVPANIITILVGSYALSVSCLFVPLVACFFTRKLKKSAATLSVVCGLAGFILFTIWPQPIPKEFLALGLSLLGFVVGACA